MNTQTQHPLPWRCGDNEMTPDGKFIKRPGDTLYDANGVALGIIFDPIVMDRVNRALAMLERSEGFDFGPSIDSRSMPDPPRMLQRVR